jgi:hypothetical protein
VSAHVPGSAGRALTIAAQHAFVGGIHLAVTAGAVLAAIAAVVVIRYLPHTLAQHGAMHGPAEAIENVAELGLAGVPPVFGDDDGAPAEIRASHDGGAHA